MRREQSPPTPSPALEEMLRRDGVLDDLLSGRGLRFEPATQIGTPTVGPALHIEPADWEAERIQRLRREQGDPGEQLEEQPSQHPPPRRWPHRKDDAA
jgi:hypothetical protein